MGSYGKRNGINGMGSVLKIPLITAHECYMGTVDIVPNKYEQ
jgi:hypothetical protein